MRFILGFIGAVFAIVLMISFFGNLATYLNNKPAPLASDEFHKEPKALKLASDGPFGKFDNRQVQRGFRSTQKSARPATASSWSRSAT